MAKLLKTQRIPLKNNPAVNEDMIQKFIFDDPSVLGLGELEPIRREKVQPSGGRLDLLLGDADGTRYEVEIQLGSTDPSHIIRTIEYWDAERKRYPNYDHCAVIVAEEITGRFMNVIQLFNGAIPLIALQVSAYRTGDDLSLFFTKVLERVEYGSNEEDQAEPTDRAYWEKRSSPKIMKAIEQIGADLQRVIPGYTLNYNKFYIGSAKDGISRNFVAFRPKKEWFYFIVRGEESEELVRKIEEAGLYVSFFARWKEYRIRLHGYEEYQKHKELFDVLVMDSMAYLGVE